MAFCWRCSIPFVTLRKCIVLESLCSKFPGFFSKAAVNFIYIVVLPTKKHLLKSLWGCGKGVGVKVFCKKSLLYQEGKKLFRKTKKVYIEILNICHTFKVPRKLFPRLLERSKWQVVFFFSVTAMEALPLLVIYLFNSDELDHVLKICLCSFI